MSEREEFGLSSVRGPRSPGGQAMPVLSDTGFSNLARTHIFGKYIGMPAPWVWHSYFNDFDDLSEFNGVTDTASWDVTTAGTTPTFALADGDSGHAIITLAATDDSFAFYQKKGESFKYVVGSPLLFSTRFKVNETIQSDFVFGLAITDASLIAGAPSDGIWFQKDDGDVSIDFHVAKNAAGSDTLALASMVDDTFITLAFAYDGISKIFYGVNGVVLGSVALTGAPDDEELAVTFGIQSGEANATVKTCTMDYIYAAKYTGRT